MSDGFASCTGAETAFFWQHDLPADALEHVLIGAVVPSALAEALASPSFLQHALPPSFGAQASDLWPSTFLFFLSAKATPATNKAKDSMSTFFIVLNFSDNKDNDFLYEKGKFTLKKQGRDFG